MTTPHTGQRHPAPPLSHIITVVLILTALSDALFLGHPLGWNVAAFSGLLLVALLSRFPVLRHRRLKHVRVARIAVALLMLSQLYRPTTLNILLTAMGLVTLAAMAHLGGAIPSIQTWWYGIATFIPKGWVGFWKDLLTIRTARRARRSRRAASRPPSTLPTQRTTIASWGFTALFGALFLLLFSIANPILNTLLTHLWQWITDLLLPTPKRVVWWLVVTPLIWALFRFHMRNRQRQAKPTGATPRGAGAIAAPTGVERFLPSPQVLSRSLAIFNAIFLLQNILDMAFLWGHAALPDGMTYAEYAHRGAYPLVATAVLAGIFLLVTFRGESEGRTYATARKLVYVWVAQNIVLSLSAAWRLRDYVVTYNLTRLRLSAAIWMLLVAGGLILICLRILNQRSNTWLLERNTIMLFSVLYACCFVNTDAFIARFNTTHCREATGQGQPLDTAYLRHLGDSSIIPLRRLVARETLSTLDRRRIGAVLTTQEYKMKSQLTDGRGWTYNRIRIAADSAAPKQEK